LLLTATLVAIAQPALAAVEPRVYVEADPATFALGGFSAHLRVAPSSASPRWTVGLGVYALDLPRLMVDLVPANRNEGWDVRLGLGYGLFVDRRLSSGAGDQGLYAGIQLAAQHLRVRNPRLGADSAHSVNWLVMPRLGYLLRPFGAGFYLLGWLGLGATGRLTGDTRVGSSTYEVFPVIAYAALHLGWSF
jgi:hypothetical protein